MAISVGLAPAGVIGRTDQTSSRKGRPSLVPFSDASIAYVLIPIYPNNFPTVPKPARASRTASLVFRDLPASQGAITRFAKPFRGSENLRRGFESLPLRHK